MGHLLSTSADATLYKASTDSMQAIRDHIGNGTNLTEAGGNGDHLTAINLPNQTMDIAGNITGNLIGDVTGNVDGTVAGVTPEAAGVVPTAAEIQAEMEENGVSILDTLRDDLADGGRLDLLIDAIKVVTDSLTDLPTLVDAVWDEDVDTSHQTAGTAGKKLDDAGGAADPWSTALPGAYGAGTAGKIIGDNVNAPMDTVDTVVDGIQTDLDNATDGLGALKALIDALNNVSTTDLATALTNYDAPTKAEMDAVHATTDALISALNNATQGLTLGEFIALK
jgi:hypothetical protein